MYEMLSPEERELFDAETRKFIEEYNDPVKRAAAFSEIDKYVAQIEREEPMRFEDVKETRGFWAEEEDDEFAQVEDGDEEFNDDEITSMAHAELELHREMREYARIAAWDMPLLSSTHLRSTLHSILNSQKVLTGLLRRVRETVHLASRNPPASLPLYDLHGRAASSGEQSRRRTLFQGSCPEVPYRGAAPDIPQIGWMPL